jgi:xanthine dehydrogenase accessory factor
LACGGSIDIFVENIDFPSFEAVRFLINEDRRGSIATVIQGAPEIVGQKVVVDDNGLVTSNMLPGTEAQVVRHLLEVKQIGVISLDSETNIFVDQIRPSPKLVAVGGGEIAIALTEMARLLGFSTIVIDPRKVFATEARFPHIDRLIQKWPRSAFAEIDLTQNTAVALLTHDPKIDDPSLKVLLDRDVFYIGALGSRKTHASRIKRLQKMGFGESQIDRIFAPIGLDIGATNPQEIALAIMSEIVAAQNGKRMVDE